MSATVTDPMPLQVAERRADAVLLWLGPFCERIAIAGSIRRERPICNDIDVVAIPRTEERSVQVDLLSRRTARVNLLRAHLVNYVNGHGADDLKRPGRKPVWKGRNGQVGPEPKEDGQNLLLITAAGVQLDVWCATPENWVTLLICRTGSVRHNIWAASRAKALGGHWQPYEGLRIKGQAIRLDREEDFYTGLGLPYVPPQQRERDDLSRVWTNE